MSLADGLFGGRIALGDEIGRGAMGVVYQAALDDRQVAVKVLHPHLTSDLAVVGRFVREHQALSRIDHPNVVTVIDMIIDDPRLGIVMEHLDFPDLGKVIGQETVTPRRALHLGAGIAAGVAAIHEARVVHRDLKPANVIVARHVELDEAGVEHITEIPKIADFGVSRLVGQSIVNATTTMGTPLYMSPEAAGGGATVGRPADIYSLGVMLFELLTGRPPYTAEEPIAIAVAHVNSPVPIVGGIPDQLSELLQTMLSKDPEDRPDAGTVERILSSIAPHISPTLQPTVQNADAINLANTSMLAANPRSSTATVLIPGAGSGLGEGGFFADQPLADQSRVDQTVAGTPLAEGPSGFQPPYQGGDGGHDDQTGLFGPPPAGNRHVGNGTNGYYRSTGDPGSAYGQPSPAGSASILADAPGPNRRPSYRSDGGRGADDDHFGRRGSGFPRDMAATTSSTVDLGWRRWAVPLLLLLLIPILLVGWSRTRGSSDTVDLETTNAAFSFLPRVGSNGLITTRRWELTTNSNGQAVIKAEVIVANTSDEPVTATHYEAFPEAADADYLIDTFRPEPDQIVRDPGVAVFDMGELQPRARFTITYEMLAPDGVESVEELQALAEDQARVEAAYVESLPSRAAQEAMDTEGELTDLILDPAGIDIDVGELAATRLLGILSDGTEVDPAALASAVWTVEDPQIAEVTASNAIRGLNEGETSLTVSIGDIEVSIDVVVSKPDNDVAASTSTTARNSTTSSPITTASTSSTTAGTSTSSTSPTTSATSITSSTVPTEPDLTMSPLGVVVNGDGSFKVSFSTNLCTIANYSGAGQSYVGTACFESHGQTFTPVGPGSYPITVMVSSADGQEAQRTTTVVIEEPGLVMSALSVTVNTDGSFRITFTTNLCTIANYSGAGQSYITPGWPDVADVCWQAHGQNFSAVEPGSYPVVVRSRSASGQEARRTTTVEIPGNGG